MGYQPDLTSKPLVITGFIWGLLDQAVLGGYLQRSVMLAYSGHNWSARPSTILGMEPDARTPRVIDRGSPEFPARLLDLRTPPRRLWLDGRAPAAEEPLAAIVGSRAATRAACSGVSRLAAELADAGWSVISGGALGIDAAAHRGALQAGGATFAVLGCGIDVVYPDRHTGLFRQIVAGGGLLSEYGPAIQPRPGQFPARNRLVAALARVVIVGESRGISGALITARHAVALGRRLLAIPGSTGTDGLLAAGMAQPVETAADVMRAMTNKLTPARAMAERFGSTSIPMLAPILDMLAQGPASADVVARRLGLSLADALGTLGEAEISGFVVRAAGGKFEVPHGA
jgi:DNA processing protein